MNLNLNIITSIVLKQHCYVIVSMCVYVYANTVKISVIWTVKYCKKAAETKNKNSSSKYHTVYREKLWKI